MSSGASELGAGGASLGVDGKKGEREGLDSGVYRRARARQKGKQARQSCRITGISNACPGWLGGAVGELPLILKGKGEADGWVPLCNERRGRAGAGRRAGLRLGQTECQAGPRCAHPDGRKA